MSMLTSSKVGLTTPMLDTVQYATIPILQSSYAKQSTLLCSVANIVQWLMSFYYPQVTVTRWYCSNRFISLLVGWSCTKLLSYVSHMATVHVMWEGKVVQLLPHCGTLLPLVSPPADPTLTTSNMLSVLSGVEERWEELGEQLNVWLSKRNEIKRVQRSSHRRMRALINFYIRYHCAPSWQHISSVLKRMGLQDLAGVVTTKYVRGRQL